MFGAQEQHTNVAAPLLKNKLAKVLVRRYENPILRFGQSEHINIGNAGCNFRHRNNIMTL